MSEGIKQHLPVIIAISLVGLATGAFAMMRIRDGAVGMDVGAFSTYIIVVPCAIMLVCSFLIAVTAPSIGRQLYLIVVGTCLAAGVVSMIVSSIWMADPAVASALLANSADGATVTPVSDSIIIVLRDIAAYIVMPTVGCIAGAWIGSRVHPVKSEGTVGKGKKKRN